MSDRKWFGDPRGSPQYGSGMYAVFLDGRKAGMLPPRGRVALPCDGGAHRVQVRQGAGRSPTVEVQVAEGETVFFGPTWQTAIGRFCIAWALICSTLGASCRCASCQTVRSRPKLASSRRLRQPLGSDPWRAAARGSRRAFSRPSRVRPQRGADVVLPFPGEAPEDRGRLGGVLSAVRLSL